MAISEVENCCVILAVGLSAGRLSSCAFVFSIIPNMNSSANDKYFIIRICLCEMSENKNKGHCCSYKKHFVYTVLNNLKEGVYKLCLSVSFAPN